MKLVLGLISVATVCWANTYEEIHKPLIDIVNQQQNHWKAGINKYFLGWTEDKMKSVLGTILENPPPIPKRSPPISDDLPESFDSREKWPQCASLNDIRDQSTCGSCWAVSSAEVATDRICIGSNGAKTPTISGEELLSCCNSCGLGCKGGFPGQAMKFWQTHGIVTGGNYGSNLGCQPYEIPPCTPNNCNEAKTPKCERSCESGYSVSFKNDKQYAKRHYHIIGGEAHIRQEIYEHGPVAAAFMVFQDFYSYTSGVYHHVTGKFDGGHAVKIIGWGVENDTKYWLVANSWNATWGMDGFFKIRRGTNECGFETIVVAGIAKV